MQMQIVAASRGDRVNTEKVKKFVDLYVLKIIKMRKWEAKKLRGKGDASVSDEQEQEQPAASDVIALPAESETSTLTIAAAKKEQTTGDAGSNANDPNKGAD